jgi:heme/copper-type cytochrome/quinol oxidase subunit 2
MPTPAADFLFWAATAVIAVTQFFILRSTRRGMKLGPPGSGSALEWTFAILPAICLAVLLFWTWHTMHAGQFTFDARAPGAGVTA